MLSRIAALECAQNGTRIRVNALLPGGVKTPIYAQLPFWSELRDQTGSDEAAFNALAQGVPAKRFAEPEEIAHAALYLASDEAAYVTGTELIIDGGYTT